MRRRGVCVNVLLQRRRLGVSLNGGGSTCCKTIEMCWCATKEDRFDVLSKRRRFDVLSKGRRMCMVSTRRRLGVSSKRRNSNGNTSLRLHSCNTMV